MDKADYTIEAILQLAPVLPVVSITDLRQAVPLAQALVTGGLRAIEVALCTSNALDAVRMIAADVPDALIGAGNVIEARQVHAAVSAGARFLVSPGSTTDLIAEVERAGARLLPGASTASEAMRLLAAGFTIQEFFPAAPAGGLTALASLATPLARIRFCAADGITAQTAADYLRLKNVLCVAGSWFTPPEALATNDWNRIRSLAAAAASLRPAN